MTTLENDYPSGRAKIKAGPAPLKSLFQEEVARHRNRVVNGSPETRGKFLLMSMNAKGPTDGLR
jgi:hypothetical protein